MEARMSITGAQLREARKLLQWTLLNVSFGGRISEKTLADFESGKAGLSTLQRSVLRATLESAGVIFGEDNGDGPGVTLRKGK
jgi:transcriptional regulator with XRE-family HTH domain